MGLLGRILFNKQDAYKHRWFSVFKRHNFPEANFN